MTKIRLFAFSVSLLLLAFTTKAQVKYSNEFLSLGVGSRALAMGNSCIASSNDATSTYWNPAGLLELSSDMQMGAMHSAYSYGIASYDYGAATFKTSDSSALGFSIIRFGVDDIPNTLDLIDNNGQIRYDLITSFSIADYAFVTSFAKKSNVNGLSFGGNLKIIRRIVGDFASAWGFGLDVSAMYVNKSWRFAAVGRDITSTFNAWKFNTETFEDVFDETGNEIPENSIEYTMPRLILAAAKTFKISEKINLTTEIDGDITFDGKRNTVLRTDFLSLDPHAGLELSYKNKVFLRGGVSNIQNVLLFDKQTAINMQPGLGLGISLNRLYIDYALSNIGNKLFNIYSHVFTLRLAINKKGNVS
ncbi:MAG TPA: hypothetical protein DDX39_00390 [Bacteroidales bacterium]|nr:MAG: hypothetical protein A2W98_03165 [Bacteroidetes bacterium GWF2_33_38]OFY91875.1 MAG: hypothetical protein A2236_04835 [Bacteroidetes bacterium RIFOXYA2_FULL_33_7]HBF87068.1 hypothetical protein [Bacteroidales bacterium]